MTSNKIAATLFETTGIGFLGGFVGGVLLYFEITLNAQAHVQEVAAMSRVLHVRGGLGGIPVRRS